MKNLFALQQIDTALNVFRNDRGHSTFDQLYNKTNHSIDGDVLGRILEKLIRDKYVYETLPQGVNYARYAITFEGSLFEGYVKQQQTEDYKLSLIVNNESRRLRNDKRLIIGTFLAGIAAFLLLLWQILLYFYPVHKDFSYWFWQ